MEKKPELLIFDVNETLLDMAPIKKAINQELKSEQASALWFSKLLYYSLAESVTGDYRDFGEIGAATLKMTAQLLSREISEERIKEILGKMKNLEPHPEVKQGLQDLKDTGLKMVVLTNGGQKTVDEQLDYAGLTQFFDKKYSVEAVKKFKPHSDPYNHVLEQENTAPASAFMIAAHGWDILGASRAGLQTGFISRPGKFQYPHEKADYSGEDLVQLVKSFL